MGLAIDGPEVDLPKQPQDNITEVHHGQGRRTHSTHRGNRHYDGNGAGSCDCQCGHGPGIRHGHHRCAAAGRLSGRRLSGAAAGVRTPRGCAARDTGRTRTAPRSRMVEAPRLSESNRLYGWPVLLQRMGTAAGRDPGHSICTRWTIRDGYRAVATIAWKGTTDLPCTSPVLDHPDPGQSPLFKCPCLPGRGAWLSSSRDCTPQCVRSTLSTNHSQPA